MARVCQPASPLGACELACQLACEPRTTRTRYGDTNYQFYNLALEVGVYGDTNYQFYNPALEVGVYGDMNYQFFNPALEVGF